MFFLFFLKHELKEKKNTTKGDTLPSPCVQTTKHKHIHMELL